MSEEMQNTVDYYTNLNRQNPADLDVLLNLAWANERKGNYRQAADLFGQVLSMDDSNAHAHYGLALTYQNGGQPEDAIREFQIAYDLAEEIDEIATRTMLLKQVQVFLRRLQAAS